MAGIRKACSRLFKIKQEEIIDSLIDKETAPVPKIYDLNRSEYLHAARHHPAAYYFRSVNVMPRDPGPFSGLTMSQRNAARDDCYMRQKVYYEEFRIKEMARMMEFVVAEREKHNQEMAKKRQEKIEAREKKRQERERGKKKRAEWISMNCFGRHQTRMETKRDLERQRMKESYQKSKIADRILNANDDVLELRSGKQLTKKT